LGENISNL